MHRQPHSATREAIIADAIKEVVTELRMVDVADYIAFMRLEQFANVADIVESAAELFLMPGTVRLGHGGQANITWSDAPSITLDLELHPKGATVFFSLTLNDQTAGVEVNYIAFDDPSPDPERNSALLEASLEQARIRKTEPAE